MTTAVIDVKTHSTIASLPTNPIGKLPAKSQYNLLLNMIEIHINKKNKRKKDIFLDS
ncbi:hypothetical protein [Cytobacillus sp. IB215665]|uniref:hypothetical protein n=1 Tax=Cytobacillus sp. IB215665 TaxID=3097357 RepID=UPI002A12ED03|nr:hypothetical protein [Cytobacillus sp. IB215665]MDX8365501.1 hypothetical protein [Cytobacillus sp. IB215665]